MDVPVLLVCWRRPDHTLRVIKRLREVGVRNLFISCDGYIDDDIKTNANVLRTREIVNTTIDWSCKKQIRLSDKNRGCRDGVCDAIDWFFNFVEEGIIIEDDVIPSFDFFRFCSVLLDRYREQEEILSISGNSIRSDKARLHEKYSYSFSRIPHIWGWALWKRTWHLFDRNLTGYNRNATQETLTRLFSSRNASFWLDRFDSVASGRVDTWDYQLTYLHIISGKLSCIPCVELVENIGFDTLATHTIAGESPLNRCQDLSDTLTHPMFIQASSEFDEMKMNEIMNPGVVSRLARRFK